MKTIRLYLLPLLFAGLLLSGCDASSDEDGMTMVSLRFQPVVNGTPLSQDLTKTYDINGTATTFSSARMYISEFTLLKADGSTVTFDGESISAPAKDANDNDITHTVSDKTVLVKHDLGHHEYSLGMAPSGEYTGVRFKIGLAGTTNRLDASQVPSSHPLSKQTDRNNHWNWNAGYLFLRMDGEVDTNADGTPDEVWEVHLGTNNFLKEIQLPFDIDLQMDQSTDLHIMVDYAKLLKDVDLTDPDQRLCHTNDNLPVANKVADNYSGALMFHGVHESSGSHNAHN